MNLPLFGIIDRPSYSFESFEEPGYSIITTNMNKNNMQNDVYISLKNPKNYEKDIPELLRIKFL